MDEESHQNMIEGSSVIQKPVRTQITDSLQNLGFQDYGFTADTQFANNSDSYKQEGYNQMVTLLQNLKNRLSKSRNKKAANKQSLAYQEI